MSEPHAPLLTPMRTALVAAVFGLAAFFTQPGIFQSIDYRELNGLSDAYRSQAYAEARVPFWNPHVGLGRPFLADIETQALYPPHLLGVLLGPRWGTGLLVIAHLVLAALGMQALARRFGAQAPFDAWAGLAFAAGGAMTGRWLVGHEQYCFAYAYLPLTFLLAMDVQDRYALRRMLALSVVFALQFLAGQPQALWVALLGLGCFLAGRGLERPFGPSAKRAAFGLLRVGAAGLGALALVAVQLLPMLELTRESNRARPSLAFSAAYAMQPQSWASLGTPASPAFFINWEDDLYAGALVLLAGVAGLARVRDRNTRGLLLMALAGVLVAAGTTTPAFEVLFRVLPGVAFFRLHSRAATLLAFALALGAARFLSRPGEARRPELWVGATAVAAVLWGFYVQRGAQGAQVAMRTLHAALVMASAVLAVLWFRKARAARAAGTPAPLAVAWLLLALWAGDIGWATARAKAIYAAAESYPREAEFVEAMDLPRLRGPEGIPPRVSVPSALVRANAGMEYGYSTFTGYVALYLKRVWISLHRVAGVDVPVERNTWPSDRIFLHGPFPYRDMNLQVGFDPQTRTLVANPAPDSRAYLCTQAAPVADWQEAIECLRQGHDVHRTVLVEDPELVQSMAPAVPVPELAGTCRITSFEPERLVVEVDASAPALLVLKEAYYPGWRARIDGAELNCIPANAWMRAVPVPAGRHTVELYYRPTHWYLGVGLSTLALVALGLAWCFAPRNPGTDSSNLSESP
ncbi:MAG: YfhO family protein [Planctomycetes bacterium]|nr:YfhO family protein [Planctomycetota bacterium]